MWSIKLRYRKQWSSFEIIILGFAGVILAGALLLMLPVASREGNVTPFTETLFTATSAACVTGLAVRDTGSYWSVFGQSVILLLIQIGGLGVVTIAVSIAFREKNFPDAAKHDAGCDFCPEGRRNCAPDAFYPQRNLWN